MTRRFGESVRRRTKINAEDESISRGEMDAMKIIDWNAPPEEKDVESALVVSDEDSGFGVEMLFTLYDKLDI